MSSQILENDQMAYAGRVPWHGMGKYLGENLFNADTAMRESGLDWEVELWPLFAEDPEEVYWDPVHPPEDFDDIRQIIRTDSFGVVRVGDTKQENKVLGVVGNRYTCIQNRQVFSFFDNIVEEGEGIYETCGSLFNGRKVWVLAKLKDVIEIDVSKGTDIINKYILLCNRHDGMGSFQGYFTPVRVVCNNTLMASYKGCVNRVSIRHTSSAPDKLQEAHKLMGFTTKYYEEIQTKYREMQERAITQKKVDEFFKKLFPDTEAEKSRTYKTRDLANGIFIQEIDRCGATAYAAYNTVTGVVDHKGFEGSKAERHLDSLWFGKGRELKEEAFELALSI